MSISLPIFEGGGGLQMSKRGVANVEKGGCKCRNAFCKLSNISKLQGHFFAYIINSLYRLYNRELFEWLRPSTALYLFFLSSRDGATVQNREFRESIHTREETVRRIPSPSGS